MDFMEKALKGVPEMELTPPPGLVLVETGPDPTIPDDKAVSEYFYQENVPVEPTPTTPVAPTAMPQAPASGVSQQQAPISAPPQAPASTTQHDPLPALSGH